MMKSMRRVLAMLLAVVMVVGLIPATVFAADTVLDAAIFCSDLHGETGNLESILNQLNGNGVDYSSIGFVGDTCLYEADLESLVKEKLGDNAITDMYSYAESHDGKDGGDIYENWDYSGEVEGVSDYYLVYTIRETDMQNSSGAATAAPAFTTWYNGLTAAQKALPIFIMSHRPLHDRRDDNAGAPTWYSAISAAAESSDIVFFWGHNHTSENSVDTAAYYVAKDGTETFTVYNGDTVVPNFTYMNAGYIDANGQNPARKPVATTVQITADSLIFQDYTTSGTYTNSSYSHNVTVTREFAASEPAATLTGISVSGTKDYAFGDSLALTVTATYSDGTTADVTAGATLSGYNMNASGSYTVTAEYEGMNATYDITVAVPTLTEWDDTDLISVQVTAKDVTALTVTNVYGNPDLSGTFDDYMAVDVAMEGVADGEEITYSVMVLDEISVNGLVLYHVSDDGQTLTPIEYTLSKSESNGYYLNFTTTYTGIFAYGIVNVPEGYVLNSISHTNTGKVEYFKGDTLELEKLTVTAIYTKEGAEDFSRTLYIVDDYATTDGYTVSGYDMNVTGKDPQTVTISYTDDGVTCTTSFTIHVWGTEVTDGEITVDLDAEGGEYGVTGVNVTTPSENTNVATAIQYVIDGNYVAYDITLAYADGYSATADTKTVTLPIPDGVNNPVVYYVSDDGATVTNMNAVKDGNGNVTFTTTHFSTYVIGESTEITVPEPDTATGSGSTTTTTEKEVYVLVSTPTAGNQYIIVSTGTAGTGYALKENTTTGTSVTINAASGSITAPYIETSDETIMWNATSGLNFQSENGGYYLNYSNSSSGGNQRPGAGGSNNNSYSLSFSTSSASDWTAGTNQLYRNGSQNDYYLRYNNGWTMGGSGTPYNVYFYEKQTVEIETTTTVSGTYTIEGEDLSAAVSAGSTANLNSTLTFTPDSGTATTTDTSTTATYTIVTVDANGNTVDGDPNDIISKIENGVVTFTGTYGTALVKVSYTTDFGVVTDYITVTATAPYYTIQLHKAELTEVSITEFADGVTYYTFNSVTNTYHVAESYVEGTTYYTTPVTQGAEITETVALKGIEAGDTYAVWAVVEKHTSAGAEDMGELGDALHWTVSDTSIATIDEDTGVITFTGTNYGTFQVTVSYEGADGKVITDTITISVTDSLYVVPGDGTNDFPEYPNEGAVRFDKTATAVGNYSETGIAMVELSMTGVPYTTGSAIDALLVLDMSTSMKTEVATDTTRYDVTAAATKAFIKTIVQNDDGTYNNNTVCVHYFNGTTAYTDKITNGFITISSDEELQEVYDAIDALVANPPSTSGTDYSTSMEAAYNAITARDAVSDNTQALVFMSDGGPTYYTYVNGDSYGTVSNDADTIVGWFDTDDNDTSSDETDDTATPNSSFKNEYYSTKLKAAGYPVYTVGLGLSSNDTGPQAFTGLTSGAHEAITSYILAQMATNSSYFYNVADSDAVANMGNIFSGIAASIKEAATDVVVEDKIGNNYTVNFGLPGYGTGNAVDGDALDGLTDFYIQVVDYVLDSTTHERTGVYTVLENFTFNFDGSLKSHTVDGVACGDTCSHVTFTNGVITAIDGTYFDYKSDSTGEYLTWTAEKLTSTELALQYFAHLDNSTGVSTGAQIPAGTYYTNEYATLTYTNVNGNQVQQEFPVPQMTWNGAQVTYVFYLVNNAGLPVNRAGRVVPFAEAVYVTDPQTYSVKWNDLEQSAGLYANYLAEDLVPDVYALYDDDASYMIHVYEDEEKVNLNNHFVIGGNVTDDYNTTTNSWTNAKTTYVFNNKSDGTKYNIYGTYIANDGNDTTTSTTYLCKGSGTVTNPVFEEVAVSDEATLITNAYYIKTGDIYTRALTYSADTTYYELTSASYTELDGEVKWTPGEDDSTTGGTVINGRVYYVDENGTVYTIVQKTNGSEVRTGFDFSNTTVAFAVVWKPELKEDVVVVDFGLDVVVNVTENDSMAAGVKEVQTTQPDAIINSGTYTRSEELTTSADLSIGTATVENLTSVRFSLNKTNGMQFNEPAVFYYEADVNYYTYDASNNATLNTTSMYSSVTVIPATTVYYEDSFVTFSSEWTVDGTAYNNMTQDVDRPGAGKISESYDSDNVYGYDSAYETMSTYSLGAARKATLDATNAAAWAGFNFYGTGFDVIALTSNTSGTLIVDVYADGTYTIGDDGTVTGDKVKSLIVDTYYGYSQNADGEWVVDVNTPNTVYQVPVMKVSELDYGRYYVRITAVYDSFFAHNSATSYDLYLDAIRIYDPAGTTYDVKDEDGNVTSEGNIDDVIQNAYAADGERWPQYQELRNLVIEASGYETLDDKAVLNGVVFIDAADETNNVADYVSYGPNNELYLAPGQAITFDLISKENVDMIQLALKTVGKTGSVQIYSVDSNGNIGTTVLNTEIKTATDLYYDITELMGETVVIKNSGDEGDAVISITNIKTTFTANPNATVMMFMVRRASVNNALATMSVEEEPEATVPETEVTEPETEVTEPETEVTEPETEVTEPETEVTEPETEATEPEPEEDPVENIKNTIKNAFNKFANALSNLFGRWFR